MTRSPAGWRSGAMRRTAHSSASWASNLWTPRSRRRGIGAALLLDLRGLTDRRMLVGTWAAADWAIRFYRRYGFELVSPERKTELLQTYWTIPDRQIETSVVLANPPFEEA